MPGRLEPEEEPYTIRLHLLSRLVWSVFDDISEIKVLEDANDSSSESKPFLGHPIALEPVSDFGLRTMLVTEGSLELKQAGFVALPDEWIAPMLTVQRDDNEPLTIGDFVTQVHAWLQIHKQDILDANEELSGKDHEGFDYMYWGWIWVPTLKDLEPEEGDPRFQLFLRFVDPTGERQF